MLSSQRFYDRVSNKISFTEEGAVNIVFLGDSVTHGCFGGSGNLRVDRDYFESYSFKFSKMLRFLFPDAIFNIINSGIGGDNAKMGLARFDRDVLSHHPDLVIISFGLNDHPDPEGYLKALGTMFDKLNELDIPCVYMTENMMNTYHEPLLTPERFKDYSFVTAEKQNSGDMDKLFDAGIALAKEKNIVVCDMYHKWKNLAASRFISTMR